MMPGVLRRRRSHQISRRTRRRSRDLRSGGSAPDSDCSESLDTSASLARRRLGRSSVSIPISPTEAGYLQTPRTAPTRAQLKDVYRGMQHRQRLGQWCRTSQPNRRSLLRDAAPTPDPDVPAGTLVESSLSATSDHLSRPAGRRDRACSPPSAPRLTSGAVNPHIMSPARSDDRISMQQVQVLELASSALLR